MKTSSPNNCGREVDGKGGRSNGAPTWSAACPETRWSVVLSATEPGNHEAVARLCALYRRPVATMFRYLGCAAPEADERTQQFFASIVERGRLYRVEPKGKFRNWLFVCLRRFMWRQRKRDQRHANWGTQTRLSYDSEVHGAARAPGVHLSLGTEMLIQQVWDRLWAEALVHRALEHLANLAQARRYPLLHAELLTGLRGDASDLTDEQLAERLGIAAGSLKVYRHHMRKAFAKCLRQEVSRTLQPGDCPTRELQRLHCILAADPSVCFSGDRLTAAPQVTNLMANTH